MSVYSDAVNALAPFLYFRFGETVGDTVAVDETGDYNGTYVSDPTLGVAGLLVGDSDTAVDFDTSSYAYVAAAYPSSTSKSLSLMFKPTALTSIRDLACFYKTDQDRILVQTSFDGTLRIYKDTVQFYISSINTFTAGQTYHLTLSDDGVNTYIYIDGVLFDTIGPTLTTVGVDAELIVGGYRSTTTIFPRYVGVIDEFALFTDFLTQPEVSDLYNVAIKPYRAFDIVIDHTKVPEDLYDFPMLVNLGASSGIDSFDSSAIFDKLNPVTSNDGFDPLFTGALITLSGANNDIATCTLAGWESTFTSQTIVAGEIKYFEYEILTVGLSADIMFGVAFDTFNLTNYFASGTNDGLYITNATTYLWPTGTVLTLPSGLSIGDVIGIKFQYDGMLITFYKNGTEYETIDLIAVSAAVQATSPGKVALSLNKLDASVQLKLQASEFSYSTPTGATPWGQTGDTDLTPITAIYINPADNTFDYADLVKGLSPIGYYRLGEDSGVTAFDEINNHNGTYYATPTLGVGGGLTGDADTAVNMLAPEYMLAPFPAGDMSTIIESDAISLSVMFKGSAPVGDTQMCCISNGQSQGFCIGSAVSAPYSPGIIHKSTAHGNQWLNYYNADALNIYDGVWHHLVATFDGTNYKLYVDGTLLFDLTDLVVGIFVPNVVGVNAGVSYYNEAIGDYDELIAFDKVLTQSDVTALRSKMLGGEVLPSDTTVYSRQCNVEVDRWDQANEQAQLWVKVPYISKDVDTVINFSYDPTNDDNSGNVGYTGTVPAQLVWTEYDAVYHLSADGKDSTINELDGTLNNIDETNIVDFGVGKGMTFNGSTEWIETSGNSPVSFNEARTMEASLSIASILSNASLVGFGIASNGANSYLLTHINTTSQFGFGGHGVAYDMYSGVVPSVSTEYRMGFTYDGFTGLLYADGSEIDSKLLSLSTGVSHVFIGKSDYGWFSGTLKEIRISKDVKTPGWLSTNYDSIQDDLVRYSNADSYLLAKSIFGSITENVAVADWIIRAYRLDTGILTAQLNAIAGAFQLEIPNGQWVPSVVTVSPVQGVMWVGNTAQLVDDLVFPTDPETTPYYYKCTVSGTGINGVTALSEPVWPTVPGQTVVDGTVTWEVVERMIQPITHSPMIPK